MFFIYKTNKMSLTFSIKKKKKHTHKNISLSILYLDPFIFQGTSNLFIL